LIVVLVIGLAVFGTGAAVLWFAFRALRGGVNARQNHLVLLALVVAFIFASCAALFFVTVMSGR
jgi:hypothetical protein